MASRGVNKVILIGNLCKDPESRATASGSAITNLVVATGEQWKDKQTGEKKEKSEFHKVSMFGKLAEIASQYLTKGSKVYIEGSLQTRKWQDKDGKDCYTTEIVANELQMLGGGAEKGSGDHGKYQTVNTAATTYPDLDFDGEYLPF